MKTTAILLLTAALLASCSGQKKEQTATCQQNETTVQAPDMHNAENALDYQGTYKGTIPAADCPGINVTLTLGNDGTFEETYEYIERDTFTSKGTYTVKVNTLTTVSETNDTTYYKVEENRLRMLDREQNLIGGELADKYILNKQ